MTRKAIIDDPYNAETPLGCLGGDRVPTGDFFVRSHFAVPSIPPESWRCAVGPATLDLHTLRSIPSQRLVVTLECAGNGRALLLPKVAGAPWTLGGVATAEFEGVALRDVLERAGVDDGARELLFTGADSGLVDGNRVTFERTLPIDVARDHDVLVAWGMNGAPLDAQHGAPVRLVVPGWYGVASVKWLVGIRPLTAPHVPYFQAQYVYRDSAEHPDDTPVRAMRVRSLIARPFDGSSVPSGPLEVAGSAWSGTAPIAAVEVSADGGASWTAAELGTPLSRYAATPWRAEVAVAAGTLEIRSRAIDGTGATQPDAAPWNARGYGNNAIQRITVHVG